MPTAHARGEGDTHIYNTSSNQTIDCNNGTLFVEGSNNTIYAMGTCFAVTMQGSYNTVIAETVINDITVYGYDQTVLYRNGDPVVWDRGREIETWARTSATNRIDRIP